MLFLGALSTGVFQTPMHHERCLSMLVLVYFARESVLFIGTQFSNLYTVVDTPAKGRVGVCVVFVFACKYVLGHSQVSQPPNSGYASSGTLAFSLRHVPPRPATDDALTHAGSSAALLPAPPPIQWAHPFHLPASPRPPLCTPTIST
jgi:hypothetical protein